MFFRFLGFLAVMAMALVALGILLSAIADAAATPTVAVVLVLLLIVAITGMRGARRTWRPIRRLIDAAGALADGDYSARVDASGAPQMRGVADSFNTMAERLEDAEKQRRRLLADLGHELRTPLTVIRGEVEAMLDGVHEPDLEHLAMLLDEVAVMERLLEDLRTLSATAAGTLPLHREVTDLGALVTDVADAHRRRAGESGVLLLVRDEDVGEVPVDPVRIREVVTNLVLNAVRAMPRGGSLTLTTRREDDRAVIEVADTGVGVAPEDLTRVFERFQRGADSAGAGLGLTICRDLVEAHGGAITIDSVPGDGTTVLVELPAERLLA